MPRQARQMSKSGIYHIIFRGINKQVVFEEDEDKEKFLQCLKHYKDVSGYEIYGYCLMDNHVHLLIKEGKETIATSIKRIGVSYVFWYNKKYERSGHLFQDRFKSEVVENDEYLLTVLRYIHHNPIKASVAKKIGEYKWSSYKEYINADNIINKEFILGMFATERVRAVDKFKKFMNQENNDSCLEISDRKTITDQKAIKVIIECANINTLIDLQSMEKTNRDEILRIIKQTSGISTRQLARITGISQSVVSRA